MDDTSISQFSMTPPTVCNQNNFLNHEEYYNENLNTCSSNYSKTLKPEAYMYFLGLCHYCIK